MWIEILLGISSGIIIAYSLLQCFFATRFLYLPQHSQKDSLESELPSLSICLAFRNEEEQLEQCVKSLLSAASQIKQLEIIMVDDHSEDSSPQIAEELTRSHSCIQFLKASGKGKKKAISQAIQAAKGDCIFTADADCLYPENSIANLLLLVITDNHQIGTMPVVVTQENSLMGAYESLESHGIMAITAVALKDRLFYSASGAALLYPKQIFQKLQPYRNNLDIPSGDDQFLLYAYKRISGKEIFFIKNREKVVTTSGQKSWIAFFQQRLRWSAKNTKLKDMKLSGILLLSMSADVIFMMLVVLAIFNLGFLYGILFLCLFKALSEAYLLTVSSRYWNHTKLLRYLPIVILMRPFIQLSLLFYYLLNKKVRWKGRTINAR